MADINIKTISNAAGATLLAGLYPAAQILDNKIQRVVDAWLSDTDTIKGSIKHIVAGLGIEATSVLLAPLVGPRNKANNLVQEYTNIFHLDPEGAAYMNELFSMFQQPNIEGITIFTENEQMSRRMDVSEQPLIVQRATASTTYATDSATPHPREWQLQGHLTVVLPTDHYLVLKPSLMLQRDYLDHCMKSRRPVWFKSYDNTFAKVLITEMTTKWDPKSMNTMQIQVTLKEFAPITVSEGPLDQVMAEYAEKYALF